MSKYYWENEDFPCFLEYPVRIYDYSRSQLINVVAEPHKWKNEYETKYKNEMEEK